MKGIPVLSVMTWAPFVSALVIMAFARHRPLLVRWTSLAGATVSLVASVKSSRSVRARKRVFA